MIIDGIVAGSGRTKFPQMQRRQGVLPMPKKCGGRERPVSERRRKKQEERNQAMRAASAPANVPSKEASRLRE